MTTALQPQDAPTSRPTDADGTVAVRERSRSARGSTLHALGRIWTSGDAALRYTVLFILAIVVLGAVVVPLSMPEPVPVQSRAEILAERYLATLPADAERPALADVVAQYGSDGGEACSATAAATYKTMLTPTKTASGKRGARLDRTKLTSTIHAMSTYCPAQGDQLEAYAERQANALKRKRAAAAAATTPA